MIPHTLSSLAGRAACLALLSATPPAALAAIPSLDLANYALATTYSLPLPGAAEASAVTYNAARGTLFVLGDEGGALVEVTTGGALVSSMTLTGFDDTEGLTWVGGTQFVLVEERLRNAYRINYVPGGSLDRATLASADLGATVGNVGVEGLSFDPRDGSFVTVKEKTPQEVNRNVLSFGTPGSATVSALFTPNLGVSDLADVQVLAAVPGWAGGPDADHLLLLSQESARLLEVDRDGNVLSQFDLSALANSAEGVTVGPDGIIYVVAENDGNPQLFALTPAPLPAAGWLLGGGMVALAGWRRRGGRV